MKTPVFLMVPGDLMDRTGGTGYDRRLMEDLGRLGRDVRPVLLPAGFPFPGPAETAAAQRAFAALPDGAILLADGLAYGVLAPLAAAHRHRITIVALCHHPLGLETGLDAGTSARLVAAEIEALGLAHAIVVTSSATAETLIEDFGVPLEKITVALPGTDRRDPAPGGGDPPVLLTVASLIPRKAHDVLVAALDRIRDRRWQAHFVGGDALDPAHAGRVRSQVEGRGLSGRIALHGSVEDPEPFYRSADLFVLPSLYEGYGMAFAEALAHGLPIVAARAGAVPNVVPEGAGLLVPPGDAAALADAIARLLDDPALAAAKRACAIEAALRLPSWADTAQQVGALIERLETS